MVFSMEGQGFIQAKTDDSLPVLGASNLGAPNLGAQINQNLDL